MYEELAAGLACIEADPAIRVAVLRGAGGKAFVAGTEERRRERSRPGNCRTPWCALARAPTLP